MKPFKALLVDISDEINYKKKKTDHLQQMWTVGFADETGVVKGTVYSEEQKVKLMKGKSYCINNFIVLKEGSVGVRLIITKTTQILRCNDIATTDVYREQAKRLVAKPEQPVTPIKQVKMSPVKTKVTVEGRVVQVSHFFVVSTSKNVR